LGDATGDALREPITKSVDAIVAARRQ
jgi:hypothetical protein